MCLINIVQTFFTSSLKCLMTASDVSVAKEFTLFVFFGLLFFVLNPEGAIIEKTLRCPHPSHCEQRLYGPFSRLPGGEGAQQTLQAERYWWHTVDFSACLFRFQLLLHKQPQIKAIRLPCVQNSQLCLWFVWVLVICVLPERIKSPAEMLVPPHQRLRLLCIQWTCIIFGQVFPHIHSL